MQGLKQKKILSLNFFCVCVMIADYGETCNLETAIPRNVSNSAPPHYNMVLTHVAFTISFDIKFSC